MRALIILLLPCLCYGQGTNSPEAPRGFDRNNILLYLNNFDENRIEVNHEYERTNDQEHLQQRKKDISQYTTDQYGYLILRNDTYQVAVKESLIEWLNETLRKSCEKSDKNFRFANRSNINSYPIEDHRYLLKYRLLFEDGDSLKIRLIFYYHDRTTNTDIIDYSKSKLFFPFYRYTADKWYPFIGTGKLSKFKKEFTEFMNLI